MRHACSVAGVKLRESVRALIVYETDSVLLVHFDWEGLDLPDGFWANPGGGLDPGESRLDALVRELDEEVGLAVTDLGPEVWTKTAIFPMGDWDGQIDHIHLLRVPHFTPQPRLSVEQLRAENVHEIRWWSLADIQTTSAAFAPRALPALLMDLLNGPEPAEPLVLQGF